MAVKQSTQKQRTGTDAGAKSAAFGRRIFYGTNVIVVTAIAAALVVFVNWIANEQHKRIDVTSAGLYGLSDRTKQIIKDLPLKKVRFTSIYTSTEKGKERDEYLPRVRDLLNELANASDAITVDNLYDDEGKRKLIERIQEEYGGKSGEYRDAINFALQQWTDIAGRLQQQSDQYNSMMAQQQWLSGFSTFGRLAGELQQDLSEMDETRRKVDELISSLAVPRYEEAQRNIKSTSDKLKGHLDEAQKWFTQLIDTVETLRNPDSGFATETRQSLDKLMTMAAALQKTVGDPDERELPEDSKPALQAFARESGKLAAALTEEANRVNSFVDKHPALRGHYLWVVQINPLMQMELQGLLTQTQSGLTQLDQNVRRVLASDQPKDVLQRVHRDLRTAAANLIKNLQTWDKGVRRFLQDFQNIDPASQSILDQAKAGELFKADLAAIKTIDEKLGKLPELKMEDTASKFDKDNLIVVETPDKVQVIDFDTVWPQADPPGMRSVNDEEGRRIFNGDAAVASTLLALSQDKPFATVIFTVYEPPMPQQQPGMPPRPRTGQIPRSQLSSLEQKLKDANFAVKDWNLAEEADQPKPEPDTKPIYVVLPPAPPPPQNPFQRPPPDMKNFGPAELARVARVLQDKDARAIFLVSFLWPQQTMFGASPQDYPYAKMLAKDWGIDVESDRRVIRGVPDKRDVNRYGVSLIRWSWMRLNSFNPDNPIGKPLQARRCLFTDLCPVQEAKDVPKDIKLDWILGVPMIGARSEFWASSDIMRLIQEVRNPKNDGSVTKAPDAMDPPFTIVLSATNTDTGAEVVVAGTGMSLINQYIDERVPRIGNEAQITFEPAPTESVDLFMNTMYALAGKPDYIGAGPVVMPPIEPITNSGQRTLRIVAFGWAIAVLLFGGAVMLVRRK